MNKSIIASLISAYVASLAFSTTAIAEETITTDDVIVKANRFEHKDTETTYASEIHTSKQIEASGAATLYDFLAHNTSLNVLSNFGNKATPSINLRGYGGENGYQNVVITVDGQRLNNIDLSPALLAGIPIGNIERIEIAKGSGSVIYGDGATAGAIQIYTKNKSGVTMSSSLGNFGQKNHYVTAGISENLIDLSVNLAHDSHDGYSKKDETGHKDQFTSNSQNVKLKIKPTDFLRFIAEGTSSRNDIRYVNSLTKAEFRDDPRQVTQKPFSQTYNHQSFNSDQWRVGSEYDITDKIQLRATHYQEDKYSDFISAFPSTSDYDYRTNEITLSYQDEVANLITGYQRFDGERIGKGAFLTTNKTTKDNEAFFVQGEYKIDALTLSAGARDEQVKYKFSPLGSPSEKNKEDIDAWEVGANYRFNNHASIFANYNIAQQAPDIDRLFDIFGGGFNPNIVPAKARTLNVGLNHATANNRLKISAFHAKLNNEIYLDPTVGFFGTNSNIDKSHKYGLEIQDYFTLNKSLSASIIYNFTRAIIDKEIALDNSVVKNKDLPGVPKHTVVANLNYKFLTHAALNLNHTWRSKAYAYNDLQNSFEQRQGHYESTNIALNYQYKNLNFFTSITNLFEHENSIQVADDAIYPVDFVRTWRVGMRADF